MHCFFTESLKEKKTKTVPLLWGCIPHTFEHMLQHLYDRKSVVLLRAKSLISLHPLSTDYSLNTHKVSCRLQEEDKMYKKCAIRLPLSLSLSLSLPPSLSLLLSPPHSASVLTGWILPDYRGHARWTGGRRCNTDCLLVMFWLHDHSIMVRNSHFLTACSRGKGEKWGGVFCFFFSILINENNSTLLLLFFRF